MSAPTVRGPIPGSPRLVSGPTPAQPAPGYVEEEWFLTGTATSYAAVGELGEDGRWTVSPADTAEYATRLLVRRPTDPSRHNGGVVVEWLNVSAGGDSAPDWSTTRRHLTRAGYAWVGVSAQAAGIEGGGLVPGAFLKQADPDRYGALRHPGDPFCFDIFTQAGRAVRTNASSLLGPLRAERMIAVGESQSASCITTYVNVVAPLEHTFDGYLVHSRAAAGASLAGPFRRPVDLDAALRPKRSRVVRIRDDLTEPVLVLQSEYDVFGLRSIEARQPDTDRFRLWEMAGTAHADTYLVVAAGAHDDDTTADELARLCAPTTTPNGPDRPTTHPINSGPQQHYIAQAAIAGLDAWIRDGTPPAPAPRLEATSTPPQPVLDELGIAKGGIRTGFVDVPAAVLSGLGQEGAAFAVLFGRTVPIEPARLRSLYPGGRPDYAERFAAATAEAVGAGFLLAEDADEIVALAVAMYPDVGVT